MCISSQCAHYWLKATTKKEGEARLHDRSIRPRPNPRRALAEVAEWTMNCRCIHRRGSDWITAELGVPARTVSRALCRFACPPCASWTGELGDRADERPDRPNAGHRWSSAGFEGFDRPTDRVGLSPTLDGRVHLDLCSAHSAYGGDVAGDRAAIALHREAIQGINAPRTCEFRGSRRVVGELGDGAREIGG